MPDRAQQSSSYNLIMDPVLKERLKSIGDPYSLLECSPSASIATILKHYRRVAAKHHPDRTSDPESHKIFMRMTQAKAFLSDMQLRQQYDHYLATQAQNQRRLQEMGQQRRKLAEQLIQREKDAETSIRLQKQDRDRKRRFEEEKEREQEERQKLKREILRDMKPSEYYKSICSIKVDWRNSPLKFNKRLLRAGFLMYGPVQEATVDGAQGLVEFKNIESADRVVKQFEHPLIKVSFAIPVETRSKLMKGMSTGKKEKVDLALSSDNLKRLSEIVNRNSNVYLNRGATTVNLEEVLRQEKII